MKIILLQDVPKIGKKYDIKEINNGYAVNFLIPKKLAVPATPQEISKIEMIKETSRMEKEIQYSLLSKIIADLSDKVVHIAESANEKGNLFSAVKAKEISEAMYLEHHISIDAQAIKLKEPIKDIGSHKVTISLAGREAVIDVLIEKK
jgi:large subunit ribosomal protein L9